jgi:CDGSH-type Zn-finger protein
MLYILNALCKCGSSVAIPGCRQGLHEGITRGSPEIEATEASGVWNSNAQNDSLSHFGRGLG